MDTTIQKTNGKPFDLLAGNRLTQTVPSKENRSLPKRRSESSVCFKEAHNGSYFFVDISYPFCNA